MKTSSFTRFVAVAGTAALCVPLSVSAASSQQLLNQALKSQFTNPVPMVMDGHMELSGKSVLFKGNTIVGQGSASMRLMSRSLAPVAGQKMADMEGQLILEKATLDDTQKNEHLQINNPVGLEWKSVNDVLYFRAKDVPMEWVNEVPEDARQYLNQWLKLAMPKELQNTSNGTAPMMGAPDAGQILRSSLGTELSPTDTALKARLEKMPIFLVTRLEKKMVVDGKQIQRLRVILNPALINALQGEEVKALRDVPRSYRLEEIKAINTRYSKLRTALRNFHFVVELNTTDLMLQRTEVGATFTEPEQNCTYNQKTYRSVCKTVGRNSFVLTGGFNFKKAPTTPVIAPTESLDLMQLMTDFAKKNYENQSPLNADTSMTPSDMGTATTITQ